MTVRFCVLLLAAAMLRATDPAEVLLWDHGAPGSEALSAKPEKVEDMGRNGVVERRVSSVHRPSLTPYLPPPGKATGAAVIIAPVGGHRFLSFDHEGHQVARWFASIGVAGFVLKYRLAREEGSSYKVEEHVLADGQRAVRLVRHRAAEWGIDPTRVGIMGFSAGGELAALVATRFDAGNSTTADPIDRQGSRPDFQVLVYPGGRVDSLNITKDTPPAFLVCAFDDKGPVNANLLIFQALWKGWGAGRSAHLLAWRAWVRHPRAAAAHLRLATAGAGLDDGSWPAQTALKLRNNLPLETP